MRRGNSPNLQRRDDETLIAKCFAIPIPCHHHDPHIREGTKAREVDVDEVVRVVLVDADRLDLDPEDSACLLVKNRDLGGLEIGKWPEQGELVAVHEAPHDLHLAAKANRPGDLATPAWKRNRSCNRRLHVAQKGIRELVFRKHETRPSRWTAGNERHLGRIDQLAATEAAVSQALEFPFSAHQDMRPEVVVFERDSYDDGLRVDQAPVVDRQLDGAAAQIRPAFGLDRKPPAVVDPVHERIDTAINVRLEDMQVAPRAHGQLSPDLPLGKLSDQGILVAMPGA